MEQGGIVFLKSVLKHTNIIIEMEQGGIVFLKSVFGLSPIYEVPTGSFKIF